MQLTITKKMVNVHFTGMHCEWTSCRTGIRQEVLISSLCLNFSCDGDFVSFNFIQSFALDARNAFW